jgi:hypothetical protein
MLSKVLYVFPQPLQATARIALQNRQRLLQDNLKMEAAGSSKMLVTSARLHGVITQETISIIMKTLNICVNLPCSLAVNWQENK